MMFNKIIFSILLMTSTLAVGQKSLDKYLSNWNTRNVPYISSAALSMLKEKPILLDTREIEEFNVSHIKNAQFVGYNSFDLQKTLAKLPKDKNAKIVVYCSLSVRSEVIADKLIRNGYTNVHNLYGGIFEWKNNGFQVVDTLGNPTEKVHGYNKKSGKWLKNGIKVYD